MVSSRSDEFARLFVEDLCEFLSGHGSAEEVPLSGRTTESEHVFGLGLMLDSFGNGRQMQVG